MTAMGGSSCPAKRHGRSNIAVADCGWRGITAAHLRTVWFRRGYLALALVLLLLHATEVIDLMRLLTPRVVVPVLVALTVVPESSNECKSAGVAPRGRSSWHRASSHLPVGTPEVAAQEIRSKVA